MSRLVKKYNSIQTSKDLRKNKITKAEYDMIYYILLDMSNKKQVATMFESVAMWFKRNGCKLNKITCGWEIIY